MKIVNRKPSSIILDIEDRPGVEKLRGCIHGVSWLSPK